MQKKFGTLAFPAFSIALSKIKVERESEEVSVSILHALESIFHGLGHVLSERNALLLGSCGAIGKNLMEDLSYRMKNSVTGIDIAAVNFPDSGQFTNWETIPDEILFSKDLIIGVIGKSILNAEFFIKLLKGGIKKNIFILSGSTKTAEFTDLIEWLNQLRKNENYPEFITGIESSNISDPQTSVILGNRIRIQLKNSYKDLYLLGGLTPLNFLYYGVPTETMDEILRQLLEVSAGFTERLSKGKSMKKILHAVDHEININADYLAEKE